MQKSNFVVKSVQNFTVDYYKEISRERDGNLAMSALSCHAVLAMASFGAQGNTVKEMRKSLHLQPWIQLFSSNLDGTILRDYAEIFEDLNLMSSKVSDYERELTGDKLEERRKRFVNSMKKVKESGMPMDLYGYGQPCETEDEMNAIFMSIHKPGPPVILKVANKIYVSDQIGIKEEFKQLMSTHFKSESETIDFNKAEEAVKVINQWAYDSTNNKIKNLLQQDDLNPDTGMVLLNAVYFKGRWRNFFDDSRTELKPFHLTKSSTVDVPMMYMETFLLYDKISGLNASYLILPFQHPEAYMFVAIPKEIEGLKDVENNLDKVFACIKTIYQNWTSDRVSRMKEVELTFPKFEIDIPVPLNGHLQKLGFKEMFTDKANFSGVSDHPMFVKKVVQKVFLQVNEIGCEAAASTAMQKQMVCNFTDVHIVIVDRPFFYAVMYKNVPLFTGRVVNPKNEKKM